MGKLKRKKKTKLTVDQKRTLKKLGWCASQEDGALMQHHNLSGNNRYLWEHESFDDALLKTYRRLETLDITIRGVQRELGGMS